MLEKIHEECPRQVRILAGDLGDLSLPQKAVAHAVKEFGQVDGLVLNHGIMEPVARVENCNPEDWSKLFTTNLFSLVAFVGLAY